MAIIQLTIKDNLSDQVIQDLKENFKKNGAQEVKDSKDKTEITTLIIFSLQIISISLGIVLKFIKIAKEIKEVKQKDEIILEFNCKGTKNRVTITGKMSSDEVKKEIKEKCGDET